MRDEDRLVVRNGGFGLTTSLIPRRRIQWCGIRLSPLQERKKLITLRVVLASGTHSIAVSFRHLGAEAVRGISARSKGPA